MVSVQTFIDFIKKQDLGRIKYALRETHFDINSKDEVSTSSTIVCVHFNGYVYVRVCVCLCVRARARVCVNEQYHMTRHYGSGY